jgi:hypothetical protein
VDKHQAEEALSIIRDVIENTREDLVAHNWGVIWLVHAFTNATAFASIGWFVERRQLSLLWYLVPMAVVAALNLLIIAALVERDRGVRSYVEWQVNGIWVTFIVFSLAAAAVLQLSGAPPVLLGPLITVTSGIAFAMMGVVFYSRFFVVAAAFLVLAVAIAAPPVSGLQWYLIAAAWWAALFVPGMILFSEKRRRQRREETRIL